MTKTINSIINKIGSGRPIVCVVGCVHGDEPVGQRVINRLHQENIIKGTLITVVANQKALIKKKLCLETNLNRCFPGKENGCLEEKTAAQLMPILKKSDLIIDIHSTKSNTTDVVIIKKYNRII